MDKYIIAPPAGSTNNAIGANDRKWAKGYFEELPDWQDYLAEATGYGIVRGCNPSITGLVVSVGNGLVHMYTGKRKEFAAATVTLDAADSTDPRIDLVYLAQNGTLQKSTGTAAESPLPPAVPDNAIAVCTVTIEATASTGIIHDCRGIKYRQPNTTYAEKAIAFCVGLPTGWYLEVATAGETSNAGIALPSPVVENMTVTDGTVTWKIRRISSADGVAVGIILPFAGNGNIPSGYLLCDGAAYSRTALPDLFAAIGTDYGSGDGSTTFNVPDTNQAKRFLQGDVTAGTVKSAGLPNITGQETNIGGGHGRIPQGTGAFYGAGKVDSQEFTIQIGNQSGGITTMTLDASLSNPIYGNSTTVQPDALTTRYIIKAFDGQTADSALINITQFENELGGKADRSLSNLTDAGKSFSFPSDTYVNVPITNTTDMSYVAPADGYVAAQMGVSASTGYLLIACNSLISVAYNAINDTNGFWTWLPVKKGDTVSIKAFNKTIANAMFVYANGEVPN